VELVTIEEFGGWRNAQAKHFGDGGIFDQIYTQIAARARFGELDGIDRSAAAERDPGLRGHPRHERALAFADRVDPARRAVPQTAELSFDQFTAIVTSQRVLHALKLSFGLALAAAAVNLVFGLVIVWALVRYQFPGRRVLDAIIDIPFALPTAVAGIALTTLYAESGWVGALLAPLGVQVAFTPLGIFVALVFIGLPFVVRTTQPVLQDLEKELEEAAASLGASGFMRFRRVVLPSMVPALLTGFALAFARAVGEYGSVIFIAGNLPNVSEIAPLLIVIRLQEFRYADRDPRSRWSCWSWPFCCCF